jgi:MFS family permease
MKALAVLQRIPRQVWFLGFVSFFNDIASEMLYPIMPIFLTQVLGTPVAVVGLIEGCAEGLASVLKGVFGRLSDRMGTRKSFVVAGYAFSAVSKVIIAISTVWGMVFAGRLVDRFGKGLRTGARDAMLHDASTPQNRGLIFGLHRTLDSSGAVVGPLLGLLFLHFSGNIRLILVVAILPALLSLPLFFAVKNVKIEPQPRKPLFVFSLKGFSTRFRLFLLALAIFSLGNSADAFLILRAQSLGMSLTLVILAYALYNFCYAALSTPAGYVSDTLGPKRVMMSGIVIYALVYLGFAFNTQSYYVWGLFAVYGAYIAFTDGVSKAFAAECIDKSEAATAFGTMQMITGVMALLASLIGGWLWTAFSPQATFLFAAACAGISLFFFAIVPIASEKK